MAEIKVLSDVLRAVDELVALAGVQWWWRGHAKASWPLRPHIHRKPHTPTEERNVVHRFQAAAPSRRERCPDMQDFAAWLLLMQHYGLPTRLLDWTESALIATYVAVVYEDKHLREDGAIWALLPANLNEAQGGTHTIAVATDAALRPYFAPAFESTAPTSTRAVAFAPMEIDPRLMVQVSRFTIHGDPTPLEDLVPTLVRKFVIPSSAKPHLHRQLDGIGINRATLFPDLSNLARYLKEKYIRD